jgi:hypothetical protein
MLVAAPEIGLLCCDSRSGGIGLSERPEICLVGALYIGFCKNS